MIFFLVFLISAHCAITGTNLVCKGDFENFTESLSFDGEGFGRFSTVKVGGEPYCWYNQKQNDDYEIKNKKYPKGTRTCELITLSEYVLCQIVNLEIGATYFFSFDTLTPKSMRYTITNYKLNGVLQLSVRT